MLGQQVLGQGARPEVLGQMLRQMLGQILGLMLGQMLGQAVLGQVLGQARSRRCSALHGARGHISCGFEKGI